MNRQHAIRALGLLAAAAVVYFAPEPEEGVVAPSARAAAAPPVRQAAAAPPGAPAAAGAPEVLAIRPRLAAGEEHEPFVPVAWEAPAPPPAPAKVKEEPPPPQAPPLPFKVLGQYSEAGQEGVFLLHGDKNLVVRVGETIAENYKVESLKDGVLTLLYLPLRQPQTLTISAPN